MFGTATPLLSASRITSESIQRLVVLVAAISTVVRETDARASFLAIDFIFSSISRGSTVSRTQYSSTSSGLEAHSSSILLASISIFCISSSSGQRSCDTYLRDSL